MIRVIDLKISWSELNAGKLIKVINKCAQYRGITKSPASALHDNILMKTARSVNKLCVICAIHQTNHFLIILLLSSLVCSHFVILCETEKLWY